MPARVLVIHSSYPPDVPGGADETVRTYATRLADLGHAVRVLALTPEERVRTDRDGRVEVLRVPAAWFNGYWPFSGDDAPSAPRRAIWHARDVWSPRALRVTQTALDAFEPDVAIVNNLAGWSLAPMVALQRAGVPTALVLHDYGYVCVRRTMQSGGESCRSVCTVCRGRLSASQSMLRPDTVLPVSQALMDRYHRAGLFRDSHFLVFHPPIDQLPVPTTNEWAFGYLGRLHPSKGIDDLIDAARAAGVRVAVAGTGEDAYVQQLRRDHSDVADWLGWVAPSSLFGRIGTLVVPSRWDEPFGRVVVEAAAAGRGVIVSDRPGLLEAAQSTGAAMASYPAGDVDALAALLRDPAPRPASTKRIPGIEPLLAEIDRLTRDQRMAHA